MLPDGPVVLSDVPPRLERLPWSRWHTRLVVALGITWLLDGLEASLIANLAPILEQPDTLGLSPRSIGVANGAYLVGQLAGALVFGRLADRFGRKRLVLVTLALYLVSTAATGASTGAAWFLAMRLLAGGGIGGEYSAVNSAIDELVPARVRGRVALAVNGSYWLGAAAAALLTTFLLDPNRVPATVGWRLAFGLGAALGLGVLLVRRHVPESPRWLVMHGRHEEAERTIAAIERAAEGPRARLPAVPVRVRVTGSVSWAYIAHVLAVKHRRRTILGLALMVSQAFFYNGIFFSYALILRHDYDVPPDRVGFYMLPFALGNLLGPLVLGPLFDRWGRRWMIPSTYAASGVLLTATGLLYGQGYLDATTQTIAWCVVFFFASSAASSAYLTVSELFPVELRAMAIAFFYAIATLVGAIAPVIFGIIVAGGNRRALVTAYLVASAGMIGAAGIAARLAEPAEGRSLEELSG
ncbi:MAG TPA: MFS transporter [Polyangiaceae bacterium]|nr:MFS transporter [Polyangiaceae bacterium]